MTATLRVHFDGKVLIPEQPVDLPIGRTLEVQVSEVQDASTPPAPLEKLADLVSQFPPRTPGNCDGAAQHDHYLYGTPKRP